MWRMAAALFGSHNFEAAGRRAIANSSVEYLFVANVGIRFIICRIHSRLKCGAAPNEIAKPLDWRYPYQPDEWVGDVPDVAHPSHSTGGTLTSQTSGLGTCPTWPVSRTRLAVPLPARRVGWGRAQRGPSLVCLRLRSLRSCHDMIMVGAGVRTSMAAICSATAGAMSSPRSTRA
jgi:hypothetical protein